MRLPSTSPSVAQVKAVVTDVEKRFGRIDILANIAGGSAYTKRIEELTWAQWKEVMDANLKGTFLMCREVAPIMQRQKSGRMINTASNYGVTGSALRTPYAAAKAGIITFTKSLALELAPDNVLANTVAPGPTDTPRVMEKESAEARQQRWWPHIPLGRTAVPQGFGRDVLFSDDARERGDHRANVSCQRRGGDAMRLKDKIAVVTGGAQGIGRAVALGMGREGAKVVVADLQAEKAQSVANELQALGAEAAAVEVNVANESSVKRMAQSAFERFGRVDILVNVAGIYFPKASVVELSEEDWDRTIDINVGSNFLCCREFVPSMRAQKSGRIISLASGIGHYGMRQFSHYAASKAAVMGFVKALAREVGPDGITVNAICPGSANTSMPRQHRSEEEVMARLHATPLPHILEPEDIAGPILFLASDAAAYITGQSYNVNSGSYMF